MVLGKFFQSGFNGPVKFSVWLIIILQRSTLIIRDFNKVWIFYC